MLAMAQPHSHTHHTYTPVVVPGVASYVRSMSACASLWLHRHASHRHTSSVIITQCYTLRSIILTQMNEFVIARTTRQGVCVAA